MLPKLTSPITVKCKIVSPLQLFTYVLICQPFYSYVHSSKDCCLWQLFHITRRDMIWLQVSHGFFLLSPTFEHAWCLVIGLMAYWYTGIAFHQIPWSYLITFTNISDHRVDTTFMLSNSIQNCLTLSKYFLLCSYVSKVWCSNSCSLSNKHTYSFFVSSTDWFQFHVNTVSSEPWKPITFCTHIWGCGFLKPLLL